MGTRRSERPCQTLTRGTHESMDRCNHCKQPLIEIDNRGERLTGCSSFNLWAAADGKKWIRLSEEDLHALHHLRHGERNGPGSRGRGR